jgi:outer membrane receptor for ferrienterochelin and colicin
MKKTNASGFMRSRSTWVLLACGFACSAAVASPDKALSPEVSAADMPVPNPECEITVTAAPLQFRQFDEVEIKGVAITDAQAKLAQPVQVICRREVERSPASFAGELLQQLPALLQHPAGGLSGPLGLASVHGHAAGTLVLLNGQRLPGLGLSGWRGRSDALDLRFLPLSAIDRVEVQTPGASSALGSDGIAGVVNIRTRSTRGLAIGAESLHPSRGEGEGQGLNVAWGHGSLRTDGYALQLHAALSRRHGALWSPDLQALRVAPASTRSQWFMSGDWALNGPWTGFAHLLGTQEAPASQTVAADAAIQFPADGRPGPWSWVPSERQAMHQWRLGLQGPWQGWDLLASASSGQARQQEKPLPLGPVSDAVDRVLQDRWLALKDLPALAEQRHDTRLHTLNVQAQRELDSPPQGPRTLAWGWHWRQESLNSQMALPAADTWAAQRQQWAVHAELKTPLAEHHEVSASLRHDQYSDVGGAQTGQLAWKWRPSTPFLMRASLGTGFRAPGLEQLNPNITRSGLLWDPARLSPWRVQRRGQAQLQAEASTHASWGFRLEPQPRWTWGAELWQIDVRRALGDQSQWASDAAGSYLELVATNLGRSRKQGIDFDTEWRVPTDAGLMRLSFKGVLYLKSELQESRTGRTVSDLAQVSGITQTVTPRHQWVGGASLEWANWVLMSGLRYSSGYREVQNWPLAGDSAGNTRQVSGHWKLDLGGQWALSRQMTVSAWLQDVTDSGHSHALSTVQALQGGDRLSLEDVGRSLKLRVQYRF